MKKKNVDWNTVKIDWNQTNVAIAKRFGVTHERVRQVRKQLGISPTPHTGRVPALSIHDLERLPWYRPLKELAEMTGLSVGRMWSLRGHLFDADTLEKLQGLPVGLVPDAWLAEALGQENESTVRMFRGSKPLEFKDPVNAAAKEAFLQYGALPGEPASLFAATIPVHGAVPAPHQECPVVAQVAVSEAVVHQTCQCDCLVCTQARAKDGHP